MSSHSSQMGCMIQLSQKQRSWLSVSLVCLPLFLSGCVGLYNRVLLEGDRAWPRNPAFSVTPKDYSVEDLEARGLRTDGVYCFIGIRTPPGPLERRGDAYWRFWPNGRVLYRAEEMPTNGVGQAAIGDCFEYGLLGYYEFDQDGGLVCEKYVRDSGHFVRHSYSRSEIKIKGDTLWAQRRWGTKWSQRRSATSNLVETGYRFVKIDGMSAEPDW